MNHSNYYEMETRPVSGPSRPTKLVVGLILTITLLLAIVLVMTFTYPHWSKRVIGVHLNSPTPKNFTVTATVTCDTHDNTVNPRFRWRVHSEKPNDTKLSPYVPLGSAGVTGTTPAPHTPSDTPEYQYTTRKPQLEQWEAPHLTPRPTDESYTLQK